MAVEIAKKTAPTITDEQRALGREVRARKAAERAASPLRKDFLDSNHWDDLASQKGTRLPPWGEAPTPRRMTQYLHRYGTSVTAYLRWAGEHSLEDFAKANPTWPMRAWAGIVLEWLAP